MPEGPPAPSYEALAALVTSLRAELVETRAELAEVRAASEPGGQEGHQGQTSAQVTEPTRRVPHEPAGCAGCGAPLAGRPVTGVDSGTPSTSPK